MGYARTETVAIATDASGDFVGYTNKITGPIHSVRLVDVDLTDTADLSLAGETTGIEVLTDLAAGVTETWHPRVAANLNTDGAALATTYYVEKLVLGGERLKVTVANGGATKTATLYVLWG